MYQYSYLHSKNDARTSLKTAKQKVEGKTVSASDMQQREEQIKQMEQKIKENDAKGVAAIQQQVNQKQQQLNAAKTEVTKLQNEIKQREEEHTVSLKLKMLKDEQEALSVKLKSEFVLLEIGFLLVYRLAKLQNKLNDALKEQVEVKVLENKLKQKAQERKSAHQKANTNYHGIENKVSIAKHNVEALGDQLNKLQNRAAELEKKIAQTCPKDKNVTDIIHDADEKLNDLREYVYLLFYGS